MRPHITSRILVNKWQRQKEKDYQRWLEEKEYQHQQEKERYERKQAESHWNWHFFRHCWNKGLRLPIIIIAQSVVNNIRSLSNLKPTVGLSMLEMSIIIIIWIGA